MTSQKKKSFKAKDRMRFKFDWDADEDTSRDYNPLYNETQEVTLMIIVVVVISIPNEDCFRNINHVCA